MPAKNPRYQRNGKGTLHFPTCQECGYRVPKDYDRQDGLAVPCSEYHVRCLRCSWPIDAKHVLRDGLCVVCSPELVRRTYHKKTEEGWTDRANKKARKEPEIPVDMLLLDDD
jgi:hypothetical protein